MTFDPAWLKACRKRENLTQAKLAARLGTSQGRISRWERAKATPNPDEIAQLHDLFGPPEQGTLDLAGGDNPTTTPPADVDPDPSPAPSPPDPSSAPRQQGGLGFEKRLWEAADALRGNVDAAEYKHYVLGLIFLKYISDAFEAHRDRLRARLRDPQDPMYAPPEILEEEEAFVLEDPDEYTAARVFWVPAEARWSHIQDNAKTDGIGKLINDAMDAIESVDANRDRLAGVLPKVYTNRRVDPARLGQLVDIISGIGLGSAEAQARDMLGRVYEYFLGQFASAEGRRGGQFYTPASIVRLMVEMIEPLSGRVYDPCCGSGGMFVQSARFIESHGGQRDDISVYGQESNLTTRQLCRMNLAIRGIEADLGSKHADTFTQDQHPDLKADYILANPPFNVSDWRGDELRDDPRWRYGIPPASNANFAWMQHILHHLAPGGTAAVVMANGAMSSMQSGEGEIRQRLVEANLIDCIVALPSQLFYNTQIPASLWVFSRNSSQIKNKKGILFLDARNLGHMESRTHRVLDLHHREILCKEYYRWRDEGFNFVGEKGLSASANLEEIESNNFVLSPGRYVESIKTKKEKINIEKFLFEKHFQYKKQIEKNIVLNQKILLVLEGLNNDI